MASQTQIANQALLELGANAISSPSDSSEGANLILELWDEIVKEVLRAHKWDFAKKWTSVASAVYTMVDDRYDYAYELPSDWVRMVKTDTENLQYVIRGRYILTNEESPLKFEYVYFLSDTSKWPDNFRVAVVARLKGSIATPLARKGTLSNEAYLKIYNEYWLPWAKMQDAQDAPTVPAEDSGAHTSDNDSFLAARK